MFVEEKSHQRNIPEQRDKIYLMSASSDNIEGKLDVLNK